VINVIRFLQRVENWEKTPNSEQKEEMSATFER